MLTAIGGMTPFGMQVLAEHVALDWTTVTAGLKPLPRRGLVEVAVSATDLRGRDAKLTAKGGALLARAIPLWEQLQVKVGAALPGPESTNLRRHFAAPACREAEFTSIKLAMNRSALVA